MSRIDDLAKEQDRGQRNEQKAPTTLWPEPEAINQPLLPVEKLPENIIPVAFRGWVADIAYRMQCPLDFVSVAAIVVAGSLIGAGCGIRPKQKDDWLVVPNLWGGVIGRPGTMKTPALSEILKPLAQLEARAKAEYDQKALVFEAEKEAFRARKEALKTQMLAAAKVKDKDKGDLNIEQLKTDFTTLEKPHPPTWRRYQTNDSTIEMLAVLLEQNPRGILLFRDELVGLLTSWDKQGRESDRSFFLEAWNGQGTFAVDRISRDAVFCANTCVSLLGGIQPSKLLAYLHQAAGELNNDGLMQRMQLLVFPDEPQTFKMVDEYPDRLAKQRAYTALKTLSEMDFVTAGARVNEGGKIPYFHFDDQAQNLFTEWIFDLQTKLLADSHPLILEHLNKYRSLMPSLALIDHLIAVADGVRGGAIPLESAERAAAWCEYLEGHAKRIYGLLGNKCVKAAAELAKKLQARKLQNGFTIRDVYRMGWHLLTGKDEAQAACDELVAAGWLRAVETEASGKPGRPGGQAYQINPKIFPQNV